MLRRASLVVALCLIVLVGGERRSLHAVRYIAFEQITIGSTAVGFTATKLQPNGPGTDPQATQATCRNETGTLSQTGVVRFRYDGVTVTGSTGQQLATGDWLTIAGADLLMKFSAIKDTSSQNAILNCFYVQP